MIPDKVYDIFKDVAERGEEYELNWNKTIEGYSKNYPEPAEELKL
jgi:dihydroxyacetone synthase